MDSSGVVKLFNSTYKDKTVLVFGHTGFKGSWLSFWLQQLGANVIGYSLDVPTSPSHFDLLNLELITLWGDICDKKHVLDVISKYQPDIIFHMAAQSLVKYSYANPMETFETNIMGTVNLLESCREIDCVKAFINVTSDKCYNNKEVDYGYIETDSLGGYDPYSASKGCSEILTNSYRNSFFNLEKYGKEHNMLLASVRAGNVIGGGDWASDRLIPDIVKSVCNNEKVVIRNPYAIRPWQFVLESLSGYLLLGWRLLEGKKKFASAWNFGPNMNDKLTVEDLVNKVKVFWKKVDCDLVAHNSDVYEASLLQLNCSKAKSKLHWEPVWNSEIAIKKTVDWYREFYSTGKICSLDILNHYIQDAIDKELVWVSSK